MRIAITTRIRNGLLYEAVVNSGSMKNFAAKVGVTAQTAGLWVRLKSSPSGWMLARHWVKIKAAIEEATGKVVNVEDVWPPEIRGKYFKRKPKEVTVFAEVEPLALTASPTVKMLDTSLVVDPSSVEVGLIAKERAAAVSSAVACLSTFQKRVISLRFGFDGEQQRSIREVADILKRSPAYIARIEKQALSKLRVPYRAKNLRPFLED